MICCLVDLRGLLIGIARDVATTWHSLGHQQGLIFLGGATFADSSWSYMVYSSCFSLERNAHFSGVPCLEAANHLCPERSRRGLISEIGHNRLKQGGPAAST